MPIIKNILAIIGFLSVLAIVINVVAMLNSETTTGTGWVWSEESKVYSIQSKDIYTSIERGKHRDAVDRVKVVLVNNSNKRELWSSYMQTDPEVKWIKADTISISYVEEESHSYFPKVTIGENSYNVILSYK